MCDYTLLLIIFTTYLRWPDRLKNDDVHQKYIFEKSP